jgi:hypothetical protein
MQGTMTPDVAFAEAGGTSSIRNAEELVKEACTSGRFATVTGRSKYDARHQSITRVLYPLLAFDAEPQRSERTAASTLRIMQILN